MNSGKIISPNNFSEKLLSIKELDEIVDQNNVGNIEFDNLIHKVCCQIDSECDNKNISTLQAYIDLCEYFTSYGDSEGMISALEASWCGYFD